MALLSIVIPMYNAEKFIGHCLQSVINQYVPDLELILIDDGSIDKTVSIAEAILQENASIVQYKLLSNEMNRGVSYVRNMGVNEAAGKYIYFVDSDDELDLNAIENILISIKNNPDVDIFLFNAMFKNPQDVDFKKWRDADTIKNSLSVDDILHLLFSKSIGAYLWQFVFAKTLFKDISFHEGSVWEDAAIIPELIASSKKIISLDHIFIYNYILRPGSITQSVHPQINKVVDSFNILESKLQSQNILKGSLYGEFVLYRTNLLMQLSRECFIRSNDFKYLNKIHKSWGNAIPSENIRYLKENGRYKSAIFLRIMRTFPSILYVLYRIKILK